MDRFRLNFKLNFNFLKKLKKTIFFWRFFNRPTYDGSDEFYKSFLFKEPRLKQYEYMFRYINNDYRKTGLTSLEIFDSCKQHQEDYKEHMKHFDVNDFRTKIFDGGKYFDEKDYDGHGFDAQDGFKEIIEKDIKKKYDMDKIDREDGIYPVSDEVYRLNPLNKIYYPFPEKNNLKKKPYFDENDIISATEVYYKYSPTDKIYYKSRVMKCRKISYHKKDAFINLIYF